MAKDNDQRLLRVKSCSELLTGCFAPLTLHPLDVSLTAVDVLPPVSFVDAL